MRSLYILGGIVVWRLMNFAVQLKAQLLYSSPLCMIYHQGDLKKNILNSLVIFHVLLTRWIFHSAVVCLVPALNMTSRQHILCVARLKPTSHAGYTFFLSFSSFVVNLYAWLYLLAPLRWRQKNHKVLEDGEHRLHENKNKVFSQTVEENLLTSYRLLLILPALVLHVHLDGVVLRSASTV